MFESLFIGAFCLLATITLIGIAIVVVLGIWARRKNSTALSVLFGFVFWPVAAMFLLALPVGLHIFKVFYLDENLVFACGRGDMAEAKWFLAIGASPNADAIHGMLTALGSASSGGHREIVELLLKKGARVDAKNSGGVTALQQAKKAGHADIVLLLEQAEQSQQAASREPRR